ncbi:helix-turn-helix domain-containing protein [Atlantibacter subterraneus]|uniref:XRE family transcriptional regulator n=1 Tax=Atlantibacter subterraneus TaxID=255519 RepID=A0A427UYT2_9ENTR|nr:helix-turn-helix domain-containing protein [Atlantibacter subterranea]MDZ5667761.1 XRE family transcriptional regulator [Atlantibacter hermannii]MDA3134245.1 XRE family transcriptional regulator [Atlantibacter subterranea]MDV7022939.1 XRE family transcriptional regulator [Atlantibacter subterranea]MDW2741736.1 XRE family transcriptional regulator [Atlantibacter subterranea]RSB61822.1 XRE family transcriptional regulator [Atlantibacter subterranea]
MSTLKELMAKESPESQRRIHEKADIIRHEIALNALREALNISQTELAQTLGISQPTLAKIEKPKNDLRLSTLKRYVDALGGELSINIKLPTGEQLGFHL